MAMPPSQGPMALAVLKAEWFRAAASVWLSTATSMRRACSTAPRPPPAPIRVMTSSIDQSWWAAVG